MTSIDDDPHAYPAFCGGPQGSAKPGGGEFKEGGFNRLVGVSDLLEELSLDIVMGREEGARRAGEGGKGKKPDA